MRGSIKILLLLAFGGGVALPFLIGGSGMSLLSTPYYYYMPAATTDILIKPPQNIYTYSLLRAGGTDTVKVWYFRNAVDSVAFKIPPNSEGERLVNFTIGPPLSKDFGVRVQSSSSTALIISGGY